MAAALAAVPRASLRAKALHSVHQEVLQFDQLYQETSDSVYRYAWVLTGDPAVAEDVTSEVFLRAWTKRHTFRGDGAALSWLLAITHNCARSVQRSMREVPAMDTLDRLPDDNNRDEPERKVLAAQDMQRLRDAIRCLTEEQQQVIILRFFEGCSHEQVAAQLSSTPNAVRQLQFRAIRRLRSILESSNAESTLAE